MAALRVPTVATDFATWLRQAAPSLNSPLAYPFEQLASAPAGPAEGRTYYDLTLHKLRVWDGTGWQNAW